MQSKQNKANRAVNSAKAGAKASAETPPNTRGATVSVGVHIDEVPGARGAREQERARESERERESERASMQTSLASDIERWKANFSSFFYGRHGALVAVAW
jgi:hypothetical protein